MPSSTLTTMTNMTDADASNIEADIADADVAETEGASQRSITQETSFTDAAILLMNNMTAAKTASNSSVTPVSNHPCLLNKSTKKNKNTSMKTKNSTNCKRGVQLPKQLIGLRHHSKMVDLWMEGR